MKTLNQQHRASDDRSDGDARDRAGREAALVCAGGHTGPTLQLEAGDALRARGLSSC